MITITKKDGTSTEIPSSANTEGVAAPSTDTGANAQEVAAPATNNDTPDVSDTETDTNVSDDTSNDDGSQSILDPIADRGKVQDAQTNSRYAAARRAAEKQRDEAVASAKAEADTAAKSKIESFIKSMNIKDAHGKLITTEEEYRAYSASREARQSTNDTAKETGISPDKVDELVSAHPDVQAAREAADRLSQEQDAIAHERAEAALKEEVSKIQQSFPEITSIDDIIRLPRYADIKEKVSSGYTLSDAVKLAYEDVYLKRRSAAAAQQARNAVQGTAHLSATRTHGSGGTNVTEAQIQAYMNAIPGSTRQDAIKAYQKFKINK